MIPNPEDHRDPVDISVGTRIRLLRKTRGISQQALAEALGVSFQQVQKYERGANRVSASMLSKVALRLGVPISDLFGTTEAASDLTDELASLLGETGALELLRSFSRMTGPSKSALVSFVRSLDAT